MFYTCEIKEIEINKNQISSLNGTSFCAYSQGEHCLNEYWCKYKDNYLIEIFTEFVGRQLYKITISSFEPKEFGKIPYNLIMNEISEEEFDKFWTQVIQEINSI